jgi:hypothetical protein
VVLEIITSRGEPEKRIDFQKVTEFSASKFGMEHTGICGPKYPVFLWHI